MVPFLMTTVLPLISCMPFVSVPVEPTPCTTLYVWLFKSRMTFLSPLILTPPVASLFNVMVVGVAPESGTAAMAAASVSYAVPSMVATAVAFCVSPAANATGVSVVLTTSTISDDSTVGSALESVTCSSTGTTGSVSATCEPTTAELSSPVSAHAAMGAFMETTMDALSATASS